MHDIKNFGGRCRDANGADTLRESARERGNRAFPSARLTLPMIVIGSTAKSEGINYPCGFPIPPLSQNSGLNEDESRGQISRT